ncbi:hypothetical protein V8F20_012808 [Naviculisporaceae sp. PSN 640]
MAPSESDTSSTSDTSDTVRSFYSAVTSHSTYEFDLADKLVPSKTNHVHSTPFPTSSIIRAIQETRGCRDFSDELDRIFGGQSYPAVLLELYDCHDTLHESQHDLSPTGDVILVQNATENERSLGISSSETGLESQVRKQYTEVIHDDRTTLDCVQTTEIGSTESALHLESFQPGPTTLYCPYGYGDRVSAVKQVLPHLQVLDGLIGVKEEFDDSSRLQRPGLVNINISSSGASCGDGTLVLSLSSLFGALGNWDQMFSLGPFASPGLDCYWC